MSSFSLWHASISQHPLVWVLLALVLMLLGRPYARLIHGRGRLSRVDYLVRLGFSLVVLCLGYSLVAAKLFLTDLLDLSLELPVFTLCLVPWLVYVAGLAVRRHHDLGQSGLGALLLLIPGLNLVYLTLYLGTRRGQADSNPWGPAPHRSLSARLPRADLPSPAPLPEDDGKSPAPDPQPEPGR